MIDVTSFSSKFRKHFNSITFSKHLTSSSKFWALLLPTSRANFNLLPDRFRSGISHIFTAFFAFWIYDYTGFLLGRSMDSNSSSLILAKSRGLTMLPTFMTSWIELLGTLIYQEAMNFFQVTWRPKHCYLLASKRISSPSICGTVSHKFLSSKSNLEIVEFIDLAGSSSKTRKATTFLGILRPSKEKEWKLNWCEVCELFQIFLSA